MGGKRVTTEIYMEDVKEIHKDKGYEYKEDWEYTSSKCPIEVKCPTHGWWITKAYSHRGMKSGCPRCAEDKRDQMSYEKYIRDKIKQEQRELKLEEEFLSNLLEKYPHLDISDTVYIPGCLIKVRCGIHDHTYLRSPRNIRSSAGCEYCGQDAMESHLKSITKTTQEVIYEFIEVHEDRYDYSLVNYKSSFTKVTVICGKHGPFKIIPRNHIRGVGCRECYLENIGELKKRPDKDWIEKFKERHGDAYDYSETKDIHNTKLCKIWCHKHGFFELLPRRHYSGWGCYWCDVPSSGFKVYLPGTLYYLKITCPKTGKNYYKIGITNYKDVNQRFYHQPSMHFEILKTWRYSTGRTALNREVALHRKYKEFVTKDELDFWITSGKTEIFDEDVLKYDKVLK